MLKPIAHKKGTIHLLFLFLFQLSAAPAFANICVDLFSKDTGTQLFVPSASADSQQTSQLFPYLTTKNAPHLLQHNYATNNPQQFGAKAIVLALPQKPPQVFFFATGNTMSSWNVHHKDAAITALKSHFGAPVDILNYIPYLQGYEFTAFKVSGQWKITQLDINSQLTEFRRLFELRDKDAELYMVNALIKSIDPEMIAFEMPSLDIYK